MDNHFLATIEALQASLRPLEEEIIGKKRLINGLCKEAKIDPIYPDAELSVTPTRAARRGDEYFNKPLNTAIKSVLAHRKAAGHGPATAEQILDDLLAGGCDRFSSDRVEALNGLRISLGKSSHTFVKLPNGSYALAEWYDLKKPKTTNGKAEESKGEEPKITEHQPDIFKETEQPTEGTTAA